MGLSDKIYNAAGSLSDWAYGTSSYPSSETDGAPSPPSDATTSSASYWNYVPSSLQYAVDSTNSVASSWYEYLYSSTSGGSPSPLEPSEMEPSSSPGMDPPPSSTTFLSSSSSPKSSASNKFIGWKLQNPYSNIRGRDQYQPSSLSAVRSLLRVVPDGSNTHPTAPPERLETSSSLEMSVSSLEEGLPVSSSKNETASQLAEGTIRALRDLELDEAMELHASLEYWTLRWERPLLSWLEAGPWIWFSLEGYNHKLIGQRVSQIQAVLARRCAAIGELQQHLLRAGWQKGVAQWGVLGQGRGQWANVAGANGAIIAEDKVESSRQEKMQQAQRTNSSRRLSTAIGMEPLPLPESHVAADQHSLPQDPNAQLYYGHTSNVNVRNTIGGSVIVDDSALAAWSVDAIWVVRDQLYRASIGQVSLPFAEHWKESESNAVEDGNGELIVAQGEELMVSSQLPSWAARQTKIMTESAEAATAEIDTIIEDDEEGRDTKDMTGGEKQVLERMPLEEIIAETERKAATASKEEGKVVITDLNAMAAEVSELLNSMEVIIAIQRDRRLEKLKGLPRIRRNWYMAALGAPLTTYLVYRLLKNGQAVDLARFAVDRIRAFFNEHVYTPVSSILGELFTRRDRETIIDHQARLDAIESLKKMIESWLEETFSDTFSEDEIRSRAEKMDMSLIEQKKEENMKSFYEINSVVRMSLIEMQFIKKELLNALYAIDDMMLSNEINMNLAAVTPAVLLVYLVNKTFRFMFYALLKVRKSREETYSAFRHLVLDMDRLLLMRDNPPSAPPPLTWDENGEPTTVLEPAPSKPRGPCVLNADDLGMLMLHIHECRTILWEDRRRFSLQTLRDVAEDLAELAGERGPVSVEQQLQIISRMCRTYPFLKVGAKASS